MNYDFNLTPKEAIESQKKLRELIRLVPLKKKPGTIAGVDVSFNKFEKDVYAGIIVLSYPELEVLEYSIVKEIVNFPYIPGLLSFREIPPLLKCWEKLKIKPDVVVVDGHGIAHPRRLGIATHFGLVTGVPTIGCAKSLLYGKFKDPASNAGAKEKLLDPKTGEQIGIVFRTKNKVKPVFVAPGNKITFKEAEDIVLKTLRGYRLPEPTRLAHKLVNEFRLGKLSKPSLF